MVYVIIWGRALNAFKQFDVKTVVMFEPVGTTLIILVTRIAKLAVAL